jgi:hypothetical protein
MLIKTLLVSAQMLLEWNGTYDHGYMNVKYI